jgi:hypothetical protein
MKIIILHPTGFEPVMFHRKTDYESGAFDHSATNANWNLWELNPCPFKIFSILIHRHNFKNKKTNSSSCNFLKWNIENTFKA